MLVRSSIAAARAGLLALAALLAMSATAADRGEIDPNAQSLDIPLDVRDFRVLADKSGPIDYYRIVQEGRDTFIRGAYRPPLETVTLALQIPEALRHGGTTLRWRWRALVFPRGGNECADGRGDSAASVYVTWKRGLRWYSLKYAWSSLGPRGAVCDRHRNPFLAQDTIILESGAPLGIWKEEEIDLDQEFRRQFESGNPQAEVPELMGIGILVDGDQTHSVSAADLAAFTLGRARLVPSREIARSELPPAPSGEPAVSP